MAALLGLAAWREVRPAAADQARARVADLLGRHLVYPELDLGLMQGAAWFQPAPSAQEAAAPAAARG